MRTSVFSLTALVVPVVVLAQDTTTTVAASGTTCAADYIVEACLASTGTTQQNCGLQDYSCQCASYQAMETCFNNCPGDPRQYTYAGLVAQYCALASQYASTNTPAATGSQTTISPTNAATTGTATNGTASTGTSSTGTAFTGTDTTGTATITSTRTSTATSSAALSSATKDSAAGLARHAGGVMAVVAGAVAALL